MLTDRDLRKNITGYDSPEVRRTGGESLGLEYVSPNTTLGPEGLEQILSGSHTRFEDLIAKERGRIRLDPIDKAISDIERFGRQYFDDIPPFSTEIVEETPTITKDPKPHYVQETDKLDLQLADMQQTGKAGYDSPEQKSEHSAQMVDIPATIEQLQSQPYFDLGDLKFGDVMEITVDVRENGEVIPKTLILKVKATTGVNIIDPDQPISPVVEVLGGTYVGEERVGLELGIAGNNPFGYVLERGVLRLGNGVEFTIAEEASPGYYHTPPVRSYEIFSEEGQGEMEAEDIIKQAETIVSKDISPEARALMALYEEVITSLDRFPRTDGDLTHYTNVKSSNGRYQLNVLAFGISDVDIDTSTVRYLSLYDSNTRELVVIKYMPSHLASSPDYSFQLSVYTGLGRNFNQYYSEAGTMDMNPWAHASLITKYNFSSDQRIDGSFVCELLEGQRPKDLNYRPSLVGRYVNGQLQLNIDYPYDMEVMDPSGIDRVRDIINRNIRYVVDEGNGIVRITQPDIKPINVNMHFDVATLCDNTRRTLREGLGKNEGQKAIVKAWLGELTRKLRISKK